jgi:hypothetical protein
MDFSLGDIPIVGDVYKGVFGDPDAVKAAYDKQIEASKAAQAQMQNFLMGQKGQAQGFYAPIQHMFQGAYGTEGIQAPQIPGAPGATPIQSMYGQAPDPGKGGRR